MGKDDLSQLQQSRLLQTKNLEYKIVWESPVAPNWNQNTTLMSMEMITQPNPVESVYKTQLSTLIWE